MSIDTKEIPLIVITGPTASGKSSLALDLAEKWGGEIICADSRTVYRGMDIGTAKPSLTDQQRVRHWVIDVVEPGQRFTAADFKGQAVAAIADIRSRGKIPFLVGGTGLYIDSVILDFEFGDDVDFRRRQELENLTIEQLQSLIIKQQRTMPENRNNKRYLVRCLEKNNTSTPVKTKPNDNVLVIAIDIDRTELLNNIEQRINEMFAAGILQETQQLINQYGQDCEALTGNIYRILARQLDGEINEAEAKRLCIVRDRQLVKRQITWLKRHNFVLWLDRDQAERKINEVLSESLLTRDD